MAGLTVTEKEHWKDRIGRRIDKRIQAIEAEDPHLIERIDREARQRALESLQLAELQAELDEIERRQEELQQREQDLQREMLARVRGVPPTAIEEYTVRRHNPDVETAITRRKAVFVDQLLAESDVGRRILALRHEREELLDTVFLATVTILTGRTEECAVRRPGSATTIRPDSANAR